MYLFVNLFGEKLLHYHKKLKGNFSLVVKIYTTSLASGGDCINERCLPHRDDSLLNVCMLLYYYKLPAMALLT